MAIAALLFTICGFYIGLHGGHWADLAPELFFLGMMGGALSIIGGYRSCESDYGMAAMAIGGSALMFCMLLPLNDLLRMLA